MRSAIVESLRQPILTRHGKTYGTPVMSEVLNICYLQELSLQSRDSGECAALLSKVNVNL